MRSQSNWQLISSAVIVAIGLVLMAIKIRADSEPGAIPLLLVVVGVAWHLSARAKIRSARAAERTTGPR